MAWVKEPTHLAVTALPSALPAFVLGYSTPFGIALLLISLQMILGRPAVWLPARMARIRIAPKLAANRCRRPGAFYCARSAGAPAAGMGLVPRRPNGLAPIVRHGPADDPPLSADQFRARHGDFLIGTRSQKVMVCSHCCRPLALGACGLYTVLVYLVWTQGPEVSWSRCSLRVSKHSRGPGPNRLALA